MRTLTNPIRRVFFVGLAILCVMAIGLMPSAVRAEPKEYPFKTVTSVGMVTDIVRNVAGDKSQVTGIMGPGVDPHLYKPTRDDVSAPGDAAGGQAVSDL